MGRKLYYAFFSTHHAAKGSLGKMATQYISRYKIY